MAKWYKKVKTYVDFKLLDLFDGVRDLLITGKILVKTEPSPCFDVSKENGMTPSQPARYFVLEKVFSHIELGPHDSFIDVGCGKGRVLAYLQSLHCPCCISGVELSSIPGRVALEWTRKYENIKVLLDDAFKIDYNSYTILFLCQPFWPMTFIEFIHLLEKQLSHSILLVYVFDQSSGKYLEKRKGWTLQFREEFYKIHGFQVAGGVRRFSIWKYTPVSDNDEKHKTSDNFVPIPLRYK